MSNNDIQISNLKHLVESDAWKFIQRELQTEVDRLTNELLGETWIEPENNEKLYTNNDLMRVQRLLNKDTINLPNKLIEQLSPIEQIEVD